MTHSINTLITVTDIFIMAVPIRLLHFWHAQLYALTYGLFTVVYWAAGGKGEGGRLDIYVYSDSGKQSQLCIFVCVF